jgi:hypothetical protein
MVLKEHIDNHSLVRRDRHFMECTADDSFSAPHTPTIDGQDGRLRVHSHPNLLAAGSDVAIPEKGPVIGCSPYMPSDCALCWEAHGHHARKEELMATMRLAQNLKNLEFVRWSSWFNSKTTPRRLDQSVVNDRAGRNKGGAAESRDAQWATFEIQRGTRRIKVRRWT